MLFLRDQRNCNWISLWIGFLCSCIITVSAVPSINVQPSPVATVTEGSVLWLTCMYDLDGGTLGQLLWQDKDGGNVATATPRATIPCSTTSPANYTPDCSQLSSNEVRLGILTPVHGDTYSCTVYLSDYTLIGTKSTQVAIVVPVPIVTFTPPVSHTVTVTPGGSQMYTCVTGSCRPHAQIEWYKDGVNVTTQTGSVSSVGDKFVTTSSYTLTGAKGDSPATVQCRASNVDGMTPVQSDLKNFVVQWPPDGPPVISGYTSSSTLYVNDTLSLSCRQTGGNPLSTLTWTGVCGGIPDTDGSTGTESVSTIIITVTKGYNQRTCGCVSTHPQPQGQDRSEITFTVHYPPSTPTISGTPTHPWLKGENGTLNCNYVEGFPALTRVEWFRNGRLQTGQSAPSITLTSLTKDDNQAGYTCRVKNDFTDVKLTNLTSSVLFPNVEYKPVVTLTPTTLTVVEGQRAQVTCDTEGNPTPRVEWLRGGSSVQTGPGTSLTLTLSDIDRSETDNYTCRAEGVSSVQGRQLITQRMVSILVQYPLDVMVVAPHGVEEGDTNVQLMCQTLGEPNTLTSQSWTQTIDQTFITDQFTYNTASHDTIVLAEVSMDDVGMYTCSVSNGVPDRNGQTLQSNSAVLDVKVAPKFHASGQNRNFYGRLHEPVTVNITFYSYPQVTTDNLEWKKLTSGTVIKPSSNITFSLTKETVHLMIKGKTIPFTGQAAVMTVASLDQNYLGNYTLTVNNDGKNSNATFSINPSGPPDMPTNFQEIATSATSITVEWTKGFNGGHTQTFVILYGPEGGAKTEILSVEEQQQHEKYIKEIGGLQPNTRYRINIYAYNYAGNSSLSSMVDIISETQENPGTPMTAIAGGVGGAIVFLLVISTIAVVLYRRRNSTAGCNTKGSHQKSDDALFNASGQNEDDDGMKPNILYESAGPYRSENQQEESAPAGKPEYAVVEKKNQIVGAEYAEVIPKKDRKGYTEKADGANGDLYAEVQKNGKKKKKEKEKETKKVEKGKKKETKKTFEDKEQAGTVYENVGTNGGKSRSDEMYANSMDESKPVVSSAGQQKTSRKKNQDGLVYLDVEFQESQNGTRQAVIHGIENRNEYALVDFTKHASPLPEDVMNNDESAKN